MSDSYSDPQMNGREHEGSRDSGRSNFRGGRGPGRRDAGGFRIRLSDNEMRAARSLQEAFDLRSTVAVLGFSVRTLAQMLEDGKLNEVIEQIKSQSNKGSNRRGDEGPHQSRKNRYSNGTQADSRRGPKPNPFARPEKPQPAQIKEEETTPQEENLDSGHLNSEESINQSNQTPVETQETEIINKENESNSNSPSQV